MNVAMQEVCTLIKHYAVLQQEIAIEGPEQLATIARVMKHNIPLTITMLNRLKELEKLVPQLIEENQRLGGMLSGKNSA